MHDVVVYLQEYLKEFPATEGAVAIATAQLSR